MQVIPIQNLLFMLLPIIIVWYYYKKWIGDSTEIIYATLRMTVQLLFIGYALIFIFEMKNNFMGMAIIAFMIAVSAFITLRSVNNRSFDEFKNILTAIFIGGTFNLVLVIEFVLELTPFYEPRYVIPLAGMIYANAMNAVSLAAERFEKESIKGESYINARKNAFHASMIPNINALLAVGLVSLPGMMTGQILSGVDPLIAARYQMVVMAMVLGSSGISVISYLSLKSRSI